MKPKIELIQAIKLRQDDAEFHHVLGNVLVRKGQTDAAIVEFRRQSSLLRILPNHTTRSLWHCVKRRRRRRASELQEAARLTKLKQDREAAAVAVSVGLERLNEGKLAEAIERFEAATVLNPNLAPAGCT